MNAFISYEGLPIKSGGAHKIHGVPASDVYQSLTTFSALLTDKPNPHEILLTFDVSQRGEHATLSVLSTLSKEFGLPLFDFSNWLSQKKAIWTWKISASKIDKAIELANQFQGVVLSMMWRFQFIDPATKNILPGQDLIPVIDKRLHNSQIYVRLAQAVTLSLWLTFPFEEMNIEAEAYIKLVQDTLPVKLSEHHWKLWTLSKNGNWVGKRI